MLKARFSFFVDLLGKPLYQLAIVFDHLRIVWRIWSRFYYLIRSYKVNAVLISLFAVGLNFVIKEQARIARLFVALVQLLLSEGTRYSDTCGEL